MKTKIVEYEVFCFERTMIVEFEDDVDRDVALKLIDDAYCDWHNNDACETCEDFIVRCLEDNGYGIENWKSIDNE